MASSFIGTFVEVQLKASSSTQTAPPSIFGFITAVDPVASTLSIRDPRTQHVNTLSRLDIAGLQIKDPSSISAVPSGNATPQPAAASANPAGEAAPDPSALPDPSTATRTKRSRKKNKQGRSGTPGPEDQTSSQAEANINDDFDFDANLGRFDKEKIWDEIRSADKSDPSQLLVSHNRASTPVQLVRGPNGVHTVDPNSAQGSPRISHRERGGQEKLGTYEPVLSPSPPPSRPSKSNNAALRGAQGASESTDELKRRIALLEAVSGIKLSEDASTSGAYKCTIWKDHKAQADSAQNGSTEGSFSFKVSVSNDTPAIKDLRYLGVDASSNAAISEALPQKYKQEMSLRPETAGIFVRRLRASAFPDAG